VTQLANALFRQAILPHAHLTLASLRHLMAHVPIWAAI
jgi:hypothetical protein